MLGVIRKLGPGLLFSGAAIGVSHLVQSTRAGADFGFSLLWALLLANVLKYPFFVFGPRYALATNESLLDGYQKLGASILLACFVLTFVTMFTIQAAVTVVTASLANELFGVSFATNTWSALILVSCLLILVIGKYRVLDSVMKSIVLLLSMTTVVAVVMSGQQTSYDIDFSQTLPSTSVGILFLVAFMGWMPAPLDMSIWQSLWTLEKKKKDTSITDKELLFDFNVGYALTVSLAVCFVALGAFVMSGSPVLFSNQGGLFAKQLINLYTSAIGQNAFFVISISAFAVMLSTTLTCLDASPRVMARLCCLLKCKSIGHYSLWLVFLVLGTLVIVYGFLSQMGLLVKIATILSFVTAPCYAVINLRLINSQYMPLSLRPSKGMRLFSWISLACLVALTFWAGVLLL